LDIRFFAAYLVDNGPEQYKGTIVGFADHAIENRRAKRQEQRAAIVEQHGAATKLKALPISPPEGVEFIATVGRLAYEGDLMNNCVIDYAQEAIEGKSFFFHVEKDGTHATARVSSDGHILECYGEGHKDNSASRFGWSLLKAWKGKLWVFG